MAHLPDPKDHELAPVAGKHAPRVREPLRGFHLGLDDVRAPDQLAPAEVAVHGDAEAAVGHPALPHERAAPHGHEPVGVR